MEEELTFNERSKRFRERKLKKGWTDKRVDDWLDKKATIISAEDTGDLSGITDPSTLLELGEKGVTDTTDVMSNLKNDIEGWKGSEDLIRLYGEEVGLDIIRAEYDKFHKDKWGKTKESIATQQQWIAGETPNVADLTPEGITVEESIRAELRKDGSREEALADMKESEDILIEKGIDPSLVRKWIDEEFPEQSEWFKKGKEALFKTRVYG